MNDFVGVAVSSSPISSKRRITCSDLSRQQIYIGNLMWHRRDTLTERLKKTALVFDSNKYNAGSLVMAEIYSSQSVAIMPCSYSFIFNDTVIIIPLEDEILIYGIYCKTEKIWRKK